MALKETVIEYFCHSENVNSRMYLFITEKRFSRTCHLKQNIIIKKLSNKSFTEVLFHRTFCVFFKNIRMEKANSVLVRKRMLFQLAFFPLSTAAIFAFMTLLKLATKRKTGRAMINTPNTVKTQPTNLPLAVKGY